MNNQLDIFYNTNKETNLTLTSSRGLTGKQNDAILNFLATRSAFSYTPCQLQLAMHNFGIPMLLTSVRRSLTTLTDLGLLEKTDRMALGQFGKMAHTWRYKSQE